MNSPLDLLGVTSLLGGDIAKGAIRYINANTKRCATSFLVVPGLYDVSAQILKRSDGFVARVLSPGRREDKRDMVGLKSSNAYEYVGVNSGTKASVCNALCEGWLKSSSTEDVKDSNMFTPGTRSTVVCKAILGNSSPGQIIRCDKDETMLTGVSVVFQLAALAAFWCMVRTKDKVGIAVSAANMLSNFAVSFTATSDIYRTPSSRPAPGIPKGNSIVTDKAGNNMCIVIGEEEHVQNFMQHEVLVEKEAILIGTFETMAPVMGFCTSIATILVTPIMSRPAQLIFAGELILGLLSGITFSSRDGDKMLERMADRYYGTGISDADKKIHTEKVRYTNRATAVAAAIIGTDGRAESAGTLLPPDDQFGNWKKFARMLNDVVEHKGDLLALESCNSLEDAMYLLCNKFPGTAGSLYAADIPLDKFCKRLQDDMADPDSHNRSKFRIRLIVDVLEALVDHYKINVSWGRRTYNGFSV